MTALSDPELKELDAEFLTWRMVADRLAEGIRQPRGHAEDALRLYYHLVADDMQSNLIAHARRELKLAGWYESDPDGLHPEWWAESLIAAVAEFTHYGHSGGTVGAGIGMLEALLMFKPLSPITSDPVDWIDVHEMMDGRQCWQCARDGRLFSYDRGQTWYSIEDPRWDRWWSPRARRWRRHWNRVRAEAGDGPYGRRGPIGRTLRHFAGLSHRLVAAIMRCRPTRLLSNNEPVPGGRPADDNRPEEER